MLNMDACENHYHRAAWPSLNFDFMKHIYSYFEKGCRKKCTQESRKVLWVVLSSLFFKEIWNNGTRGGGRMFFRVLKESNKRRFDSYSVRNRVLIISHITFRDCRVHIFADNLSRNSCICNSRRVLLLSTQVAQVRNMSIGGHRQCCVTFEI